MKKTRAFQTKVFAYLVCTVLLALASLVLGQYPLYILTSMFTLVVAGQAWNLMAGYGGLISLGNQAFIGVGGYAMTLIILHWQWPLALALPAGGLAATLFAVCFMFPLFRLRNEYFAIGSLILALAVQTWTLNWKFAGGAKGLNIPPDVIPDQSYQYLIALGIAAAITIILQVLVHSSRGLALLALRDDQDAAETSGVNTLRTKMAAVAFAAFFTGLAGGLTAIQLISIQPESMFSPKWITDLLIMVTLGGFSTLLGPVVGAGIVIALQLSLQNFLTLHVIIKGILIILVIRFMPAGIVPQFDRGAQFLWSRAFRGKAKKEVVKDGGSSANQASQ